MNFMGVTDASPKDVRKIEDALESNGWAAVVYAGDDSYPPFAHTIGLGASFAHPEVFLLGFPPEKSRVALNAVVRHLEYGLNLITDLPEDGVANGFAVRKMEDNTASRLGFVARELYENEVFDAVQLFLPDDKGLYPWDAGCDPSLAWIQTVLLDVFGDQYGTPRPH